MSRKLVITLALAVVLGCLADLADDGVPSYEAPYFAVAAPHLGPLATLTTLPDVVLPPGAGAAVGVSRLFLAPLSPPARC